MISIGSYQEAMNVKDDKNYTIINLSGTPIHGDATSFNIPMKDQLLEIKKIMPSIITTINLINCNKTSYIFINCNKGINRSPLILASYLIINYGYKAPEAIKYVKNINYKKGRPTLTNVQYVNTLYYIDYIFTENHKQMYKQIDYIPNAEIISSSGSFTPPM